MEGWQVKPLGDLCEFQRGLTYGKSDEVDVSSNVVLRANNVDLATHTLDLSELRYISDSIPVPTGKKLRKGSLLICTASGSKSHLGNVAYVDDDYGYAFGGFMGQITPASGLDGRYLFHALTSPAYKDFIETLSDGVNINNLKFDDLRQFPVPVPPLLEQRRIVAILDEAFEGIASAKFNVEKNLQNARELGDQLRNGLFVKIAAESSRRRLGDVCTFVRGPFGGSLKKDSFVKDGYAVYEQSHAIYDQFSEVRYFVNEAKFKEMSRFELRPNDLIMSCSGTLGRVAIAPPNLRRGIINQALLKLTPGVRVEAAYLRYWMESHDFQDALAQCSGGAAIQNVASVSVLKEIALPLPSVPDQRSAVDQLDRFTAEADSLQECYERKLAALDELKKSLLHQAFTGALTTKTTDKQLEAVA